MDAETLLRLTLATSLGIVLVLLLRRPLRAAFGAQVAYLAWCVVPLLGLAALLPAPSAGALGGGMMAELPALRVEAITALAPPVDASTGMGLMLPMLWLGGVLLSLGWFALQQHRYVLGLGELRPNGEDGFLSERSDAGPALVGALRPRLVLPCDFHQRYDPTERALILAHERVHLRRGDALVNALVVGLRCLFWFNPLVHLAAARFRFDQELACDAAVLTRFPEARRSYAGAMLKTQLTDPGLPVGCHWQSSHPFKERIQMLTRKSPGGLRRRTGMLLTAALSAGLAGLVWAQGGAAAPGAQETPPAPPPFVYAEGDVPPSEDASYRRMVPPRYPADAIRAREQGEVIFRVMVDEHGDVADLEVERSSGSVLLDEAGAAAVAQWKFNVGRRNGEPVSGWVLVPIHFSLDGPPPERAPQAPLESGLPMLDTIQMRGSEG